MPPVVGIVDWLQLHVPEQDIPLSWFLSHCLEDRHYIMGSLSRHVYWLGCPLTGSPLVLMRWVQTFGALAVLRLEEGMIPSRVDHTATNS